MFEDLPLLIVLVDLAILLCLLMINLVIVGFLLCFLVMNYLTSIITLPTWLKLNSPKQLKFFVLTMHVNLPNMHLKIFYIPKELFINSCAQAPFNKTKELNENFDTSLTLFVLSSCLPKFMYLFEVKLFSLLPMPSIIFQVQLFLIRLLMSTFLDLHLTINISDPLALPVSSFFGLMNTTNQSLILAFVASLVMVKLKRDIDVMILLLITFASPAMLYFGSIVYSLRYLNFVPPSPSPSSLIFFWRCLLLLQRCLLLLQKCLPPFCKLSCLITLLDHPLTRHLILRLSPWLLHLPRILHLQPHFATPFK